MASRWLVSRSSSYRGRMLANKCDATWPVSRLRVIVHSSPRRCGRACAGCLRQRWVIHAHSARRRTHEPAGGEARIASATPAKPPAPIRAATSGRVGSAQRDAPERFGSAWWLGAELSARPLVRVGVQRRMGDFGIRNACEEQPASDGRLPQPVHQPWLGLPSASRHLASVRATRVPPLQRPHPCDRTRSSRNVVAGVQIRIVLSWSANPSDLDIHMVTPTGMT